MDLPLEAYILKPGIIGREVILLVISATIISFQNLCYANIRGTLSQET